MPSVALDCARSKQQVASCSRQAFSSASTISRAMLKFVLLLISLAVPHATEASRLALLQRQTGIWQPLSRLRGGQADDAWSMHTTEDGRVYYFNHVLGTSTWDPPASLGGWTGPPAIRSSSQPATVSVDTEGYVAASNGLGMPEQAPGQLTGQPADSELPHGWVMQVTAEGQPYYFNSITGMSQWEPPTVSEPQQQTSPAAAGPDDGTSSTPAAGDVSSMSDAGADAASPRPAALAGGWRMLQTDDGQPYFYNELSGVSQWEAPVPAHAATGADAGAGDGPDAGLGASAGADVSAHAGAEPDASTNPHAAEMTGEAAEDGAFGEAGQVRADAAVDAAAANGESGESDGDGGVGVGSGTSDAGSMGMSEDGRAEATDAE
eukprot:946126-Pleurochrysis_carterae.AAC.1